MGIPRGHFVYWLPMGLLVSVWIGQPDQLESENPGGKMERSVNIYTTIILINVSTSADLVLYFPTTCKTDLLSLKM